jgi:hypothetical protein
MKRIATLFLGLTTSAASFAQAPRDMPSVFQWKTTEFTMADLIGQGYAMNSAMEDHIGMEIKTTHFLFKGHALVKVQ